MPIKNELIARWENWKIRNSEDGYSAACVKSVEEVVRLLDEGKTPKEAYDGGINGHDLTGFMAGMVAESVSFFHERGSEFKDFWNAQYNVGKGAKGVVNPALLTTKE